MSAATRFRHALTTASVFVALIACPFDMAGGAESATDPAPREFGGHLFAPSTLVPDPFVSTSLQTITGGGTAVDLVVPIHNLDGEQIGETSSDIGFMRLGFAYQHALGRSVALRVEGSGSGRLGTSATAILAEGISAFYGYGFGATVNVARKPAWQLSATVDARGNTLYDISPLSFVRSVVNSVGDGDTLSALEDGADSLLAKGDNTRYLAGLRAAYTPAAWIGFTTFLETGIGDRFFEGNHDIGVTNFGVTASFDLNPLKRVPIGLLGAFRNESLSERGDDVGSAQTYGLSVSYTGRRFFSVGLESTWSQLTQANSDDKIDVALTQIVLRYDFN